VNAAAWRVTMAAAALMALASGLRASGGLFVHQVGSFAGVWLGGTLADRTGADRPTWMIDIALAALALALAPFWPLRRMQAGPTPRRATLLPAPR
jgi:predicted MFS family arabinose efflux permease